MEKPAQMRTTKEHEQAPARDHVSQMQKWLNVLAYPISAAYGLWTTNREINEELYKGLKNNNAFDKAIAKYKPKHQQNIRARLNNTIDLDTFSRRYSDCKDTFSKATTQVMEKLGVENSAFNGYARWRSLGREDRRNVLRKGFQASAICIGATLAIANTPTAVIRYFLGGDKQAAAAGAPHDDETPATAQHEKRSAVERYATKPDKSLSL